MAKAKESVKGADAEQSGSTATPSEAAPGVQREYLDVWTDGKYRVKIGAAFPQKDGSLKVFLNALPIGNSVSIVSKNSGEKPQKQ